MMTSPEYRFRQMKGYCLFFMFLCLFLFPATVSALDPEFGRVVPDVSGMTVEQARVVLEGRGLQLGEVRSVRANVPAGTIVRQEPGNGAETTVGSQVHVWVAKRSPATRPAQPPQVAAPDSRELSPQIPSEPLHAEISPLTLEVLQGKAAFFESRSFPRDGIHEEWRGPLNQRASGERFEVGTGNLQPGRYAVTLNVTNNREQSARARATLVVTAPAVPPPTTGPEREVGPEGASQRYRVSIISDRAQVRQFQPVTFTAELLPGRRDVYYRFHFGDGARSETRAGIAHHEYGTASSFEAFVVVLDDHDSVIAESSPVVIEVAGVTPPADHPQGMHIPMWFWIGAALSAGILLGYYLFSRKNETSRSDSGPGPRLRIVSRTDEGTRNMAGDLVKFCGPEISLRPVGDIGVQEIAERRDPFIREERWENE